MKKDIDAAIDAALRAADIAQLLVEQQELYFKLRYAEEAEEQGRARLLVLSPHSVGDTIEYEERGTVRKMVIKRVNVRADSFLGKYELSWSYYGVNVRKDGTTGMVRAFHSIKIEG